MKLGELLKKTDVISASADPDSEITGLSYDTRTLRDGELFVAIKGYQQDGHRYIAEAHMKGAACMICEDIPVISVPYIQVGDARKVLAQISAAWFGFPAQRLKITGITGTNGKTTVSNLLKHVTEQVTGKKTGLIGTNFNMIGERELPAGKTTPESYQLHELLDAMVREDCEYAVMEVSSHALSLHRVHGIEFETGIFTNLTNDHLDFHGTMEEYAAAKAILFGNCKKAVINADDRYASVMRPDSGCTVKTYGVETGGADLKAVGIKYHRAGIEFDIDMNGSLRTVSLPVPGMFSVYNALAVLAAADLSGFETAEVIRALGSCRAVKGRAEVIPLDKDFTILIDYAHTPDALENIIRAVRGPAEGRIFTLFGCGGDRDREKRPLMGAAAAKLSDYVIVTSDNPRTEDPSAIIGEIITGMEGSETPYKIIENRRDAIHFALTLPGAGDVLILAGKGHETYQILGTEKIHFDEREIVKEFFTVN